LRLRARWCAPPATARPDGNAAVVVPRVGHDPATCLIVVNTYRFNFALTFVFERLDCADATQIILEEGGQLDQTYYVARSPSKRTFVDRPLAVRLRADGAVWGGSIARDPCAVS
jgi:hypothetical protein